MMCPRGREDQQSQDADTLFWIPALPLTLGRIFISLRLTFFVKKKKKNTYLTRCCKDKDAQYLEDGRGLMVGPSPHWDSMRSTE